MATSEMTSLLFRLPETLKDKLSKRAKQENRSINAMLLEIVSKELNEQPSQQTSDVALEHRHFLGRLISPKQFAELDGLVKLDGIYYRYLIESNRPFDPTVNYTVIEALGNILTLRPLSQE